MREHVNGKEESYRSLPPAVPLAITPTSRRWTHTADDSYFYQLSLVVATATVSLIGVVHAYLAGGVGSFHAG